MQGGCISPGEDHWYLTFKKRKNLRVRVRIRLELGLEIGIGTKLFYILIYDNILKINLNIRKNTWLEK